MSRLLTSAQMREADRRTIEELGLPGIVLMENAGAAVVEFLRGHFPDLEKKRILILAGGGNNGGDGFVIARRLLQLGCRTTVLLFARGEHLGGDARVNHEVYRNLGGRLREVVVEPDLEGFDRLLDHSGVVVDAIFGTGLLRPVGGIVAMVIDRVNRSRKPVVAVDIPSGVSADTGQLLGSALRADWTVTFAAEKIGHRTFPGAELCGEIHCVPIGIPDRFIDTPDHAVAINDAVGVERPGRPVTGHKGSFGHLLVVAGGVGKAGAAALVVMGAQRMGPGLITVATPAAAQAQVAAPITEAMTLPLPDTGDGEQCLARIRESGVEPRAMAIGPGLGSDPWVGHLVTALMEAVMVPAVLDADALNVLAARGKDGVAAIARGRAAPVVVTPHPGEMARLTGRPVEAIGRERLAIATRAAQEWECWVVLKGAGSVIASPDGKAWINVTGNSGLAAGGAGDLLTGVIAGLLTQGWSVESAVRTGVRLHGAAADADAARSGVAGMIARDLLPHLRRLRNGLAD
ncbi:MAG: NAD(P)H-hydrate dehydratase [Magnetococcales bacterium]|nr:NAD(P)H-hydrate dehydratase [Magnetococcales bacterium]MBF0157354.1 NAD(P)H-hydrate dehydratase [Magnetococcales bacterium]